MLRPIRNAARSWRTALALAAGALLGVAFPAPGWAGCAWVAPALLLAATIRTRPRHTFGLGFLAGLTHYLVSLRWLLNIPFPAGAVAAWLALSGYMALYPGLWAWLCWRLLPPRVGAPARGVPSVFDPAEERAWLEVVRPVGSLPWAARTCWALLCAAAWVTTEMIAAHLLSGFPWNPIGVSQYEMTPLIQCASVTGVPGVSFLVVWTSVSLFIGSIRLARRLAHPWRADLGGEDPTGALAGSSPISLGVGWLSSLRFAMLADLVLPLCAVIGVTAWGARVLVQPSGNVRELRLALVQPSIPQRLLWDPDENSNRFNRLLELTALALATKPDLLVWPEASLPELAEAEFQRLTRLLAQHGAWMVFGADDAERGPDGTYRPYNSAFLFDPQGRYVETYRKQRLVIFGEYVPFEGWLPWMRHLTPIEGSFHRGPAPVPFRLTEPRATFSVLICFEDVFARGARQHVAADTDFLLNLTNDGWFGEGPAQWQHAIHAAFRAIENGLPLVRCTNNGLTCWMDERGRIREGIGYPDGDSYAPGFIQVRLPLPEEGAVWEATFYRRHGDVFGWGCSVGCGLWVILGRRAPLRRPHALRALANHFRVTVVT